MTITFYMYKIIAYQKKKKKKKLSKLTGFHLSSFLCFWLHRKFRSGISNFCIHAMIKRDKIWANKRKEKRERLVF